MMAMFIHKLCMCLSLCVSACVSIVVYVIAEGTEDETDGKNGFNPWPGFRFTGLLRTFPVVCKLCFKILQGRCR